MDRGLFAMRLVDSLRKFGYVRRGEKLVFTAHPTRDGVCRVLCAEFIVGQNINEWGIPRQAIFSSQKTASPTGLSATLYKMLNNGLERNHIPALVMVPKGRGVDAPSVDGFVPDVHDGKDWPGYWIQLILSRETTRVDPNVCLACGSFLP